MLLLRLGENASSFELVPLEVLGMSSVSTGKMGGRFGVATGEDLLVLGSKFADLLDVSLLELLLGGDQILLAALDRVELAGQVVVLVLSGQQLVPQAVELGGNVESL